MCSSMTLGRSEAVEDELVISINLLEMWCAKPGEATRQARAARSGRLKHDIDDAKASNLKF